MASESAFATNAGVSWRGSGIRIANAPCSWGVLEFDLAGKGASCAQVLDEMAASGYVGTELGDWGFMPTQPDALRHLLQNRHLEVLGAFVPVMLVDRGAQVEGMATALKTARLLAAVAEEPFLILADDNGRDPVRTRNAGRIGPEHGLTEHQWDTFARGAERIAKAVRDDCGLRTVFHHHCAGYVETPQEVATLMARTDPALLGLCLDTGHCGFGGGDPLEALEQHRERIWHVHFKDCEPALAQQSRDEGWDYFESVRRGVFCELGKGAIDFPSIVDRLLESGYEGWIVVEQDVLPGMGAPLESARRNRAYLASIGL